MRNTILGNDLRVARIIEHERRIHSMERFIHSFDTNDDLAGVHLTNKMLAPQSRLADLSNTVIPVSSCATERPIVSQNNSVRKFILY